MGADFRVGHWLVEPSLNSISRDGATIRLEPKVMEVLVCLADHAGNTLSKEELLSTVWPDTFVSDDVLKHSISELRRVFQDDAREPHIIQTIAKRGYRFIAPVHRTLVEETSTTAESATRDSIAVLPFINMSSDLENEFFADGITEEIINALAQLPQLHVAARSSAFSFKGKPRDPRLVGEQLKVRTVLEGSVRKTGQSLRITAQLINAADGFHLWSERYDREMKDIFAIQDDIARSIAERLRFALAKGEQDNLVKAGTTNLEAYQLYLKGRTLLYRRGGTIPPALECFGRAVGLDPNYAPAWAGLADAYCALGYFALARPETCMAKGMEAAHRAMALAPSLAEAHLALAMASLMGAWNRAEAEREFLRALELNPKHLQICSCYALYYLAFSEGRLNEAVTHAKLTLDREPLSSYAHTAYGMICVCAKKPAEAVQVAQRAVDLDPDSYIAHHTLHLALHLCGRFEESIAVGEKALAISGRHSWSLATLAVTFADWGKSTHAEAVYAELLGRARSQYVSPVVLSLAATAASKEKEAIGYASLALETHDPVCLFFSRHWPQSERWYAYPRFHKVVARMGRTDWLGD